MLIKLTAAEMDMPTLIETSNIEYAYRITEPVVATVLIFTNGNRNDVCETLEEILSLQYKTAHSFVVGL